MVILKGIEISHLEALLTYMYVGEVDVKESELDSLIKAAKFLSIKGLFSPDGVLTVKKSSKNQEKFDDSSNKTQKDSINDISLLPSRKRQRKDFENEENDFNSTSSGYVCGDFENKVNEFNSSSLKKGKSSYGCEKNDFNSHSSEKGSSEILHSVANQTLSSSNQVSLVQDNIEPKFLPVNQIKVETENRNYDSCNLNYNSGVDGQDLLDQDFDSDYYPSFTEVEILKEEIDFDEDQVDYNDCMEAGPSGFQEVCFIFIFS